MDPKNKTYRVTSTLILSWLPILTKTTGKHLQIPYVNSGWEGEVEGEEDNELKL